MAIAHRGRARRSNELRARRRCPEVFRSPSRRSNLLTFALAEDGRVGRPVGFGAVSIDVTDLTFQAEVLDKSMSVAVVVDLWAPWCGPCKTLGPVLEKVCAATNGQVVLAKVNVDENPSIAQAFRVQSIPAVYAMREGKIVNGFMGALPEHEVESFVNALLPDQSALLVDEQPVEEDQTIQIPQDGKDEVLDALLPLVKTDEDARKKFLDLLEEMGAADPRVAVYRKRFTAQIF